MTAQDDDYSFLLQAWVAAWNTHDTAALIALHHDHFVGVEVSDPASLQGHGGVQHTAERFFSAFPDLFIEIKGVISQDDALAVQWTLQGTHLGPFMNIPPSGRSVNVLGVSLLQICSGKIASTTHIWDVAGLLRDIGLLPRL